MDIVEPGLIDDADDRERLIAKRDLRAERAAGWIEVFLERRSLNTSRTPS
jgi:hypothetical protein